MRILFIQPPLGDGNTRMPLKQRLFPWGFATVARFLEDDGHEVTVLDVYAKDLVKTEVKDYLDEQSFECVCITGFSSINYLYVLWLAEMIKERYSLPVVVGGLLADHHFDLLLSKGTIDICVIGEGELTAVDLFRNIGKLSAVKGIAYRDKGSVKVNESRNHIMDLDTLPMPDFDLWDMDRYTKAKMYAHDSSTAYECFGRSARLDLADLWPNMVFLGGRGCPYRCKFCSRSYDQLRLKSVSRIVDEIKYLKEHYQLRSVHFADELLLVGKKRILKFCREIKKLDLYWDGQGRVNLVDKEAMLAMKDANCLSLGLGVESGSDKMLKAMNKGVTREQTLRVLKEAREVGLHLKIQLMGGYPGENKKTLSETASLLKEAGLPPRRLTWCTPLPGSELYEEAKHQGLIEHEEAYIIKLQKGYNNPITSNVILNVSGNTDDEMIRLFKWVHMKMDINYLMVILTQKDKVFRSIFWRHLDQALTKIEEYYASCFENPQLSMRVVNYALSLICRLTSVARRLIFKLGKNWYHSLLI